MKLIDNKDDLFLDELKNKINNNSKINIVSNTFSINALDELRNQLNDVNSFKFIFSKPTFITPKTESDSDKISRLEREHDILGNEYESKNRTNFQQKRISKEVVEWLKKDNIEIKSYISNKDITGFANIDKTSYMPLNSFTTTNLGLNNGNNYFNFINQFDENDSKKMLVIFKQLWDNNKSVKNVKEELIKYVELAYKENSPDFIYYIALYNIFNENLNPNELLNNVAGFKDSKIWNKLYDFQQEAAIAIINKLEKYNGCILADSVGLGKTFTALAVIKYYQCKNQNCLVICPKRLSDNWNDYKYTNKQNPLKDDYLRYDVVYHTDLSRESGKLNNGIDIEKFNWSNYDLIVIDESHNFRNGDKTTGYKNLLDKVINDGINTKVLMLSATPINNQFSDLQNQILLASGGNIKKLTETLNLSRSVDSIIRTIQNKYNDWTKSNNFNDNRNFKLIEILKQSPDFFMLLDKFTIARSRKQIVKYYDINKLGSFPQRKPPISITSKISENSDISYEKLVDKLYNMNYSIYTPTKYIVFNKDKYKKLFKDDSIKEGFTQEAREQGIVKLMSINLLKRMESSVVSFSQTVERMLGKINNTLNLIEKFNNKTQESINLGLQNITDDFSFDYEDSDDYDALKITDDIQINLNDMDLTSWKDSLIKDKNILTDIYNKSVTICNSNDGKLNQLYKIIDDKITNPQINEKGDENKKILIFTAFADTAEYLYENIKDYVKSKYNIETALVTGGGKGKCTIQKLDTKFNTLLTCFSPISKERDLLMPEYSDKTIDILIATDCVSEGQNLQDCDYLINYDIHWNPVRIVQRFGRIDRIGSINKSIQLINFWPEIELDKYINLKQRVEDRMVIVNAAATGDDNILENENSTEINFRINQLQKLKTENVDIENLQDGISIIDMGLNEFRLDLLHYNQDNKYKNENYPLGLYAVLQKKDKLENGVIFVLKNKKSGNNDNKQNPITPYFLTYVSDNNKVIYNYQNTKEILTILRNLTKGNDNIENELCNKINNEPINNNHLIELLKTATSNLNNNLKVDLLDSLSQPGGINTSLIDANLDNFDLVCYFILR